MGTTPGRPAAPLRGATLRTPRPVVAVVGGILLAACGAPSGPTGQPPTTAASPSSGSSSASSGDLGPSGQSGGAKARCEDLLATGTVRGLLGGTPEVEGGRQRVTGSVTQTRCLWVAPNGLYLSVVSLDGPGLQARAATVTAGAQPVEGRPGILYDPARGLIVTVDDRLHQVVAGGAGTARARVVGLKAIEAIRAGA